MDIVVLILCLAFSVFLDLGSFLGRRAIYSIFAIFGSVGSGVITLVLQNDGNLTTAGTTLAAANGNFISDFNGLIVVCLCIVFFSLYIAALRAFNI